VITITAPGSGTEIPLPDDPMASVGVEFTLTEVRLQGPGTCAGATDCGHILVNVDGDDCDIPPDPWNNITASSPATAMMAHCPSPVGQHTITLSLRNDDGTAFLDADGTEVRASIILTTTPGAPPALSILAPAEGAHVFPGPDPAASVPVTVAVENVMLMDPGGCTGMGGLCGHLAIYVDGDACNDGSAPNSVAGTTEVLARLSLCPQVTGAHTFAVEIHDDTGAALLGDDGSPLRAEVHVTVDELPQPSVVITSPTEGAIVTTDPAQPYALPVAFEVSEMTLAAPGTCPTGVPGCGHVMVQIDGEACNEVGHSANGVGFESPLSASFATCPVAFGQHEIRVLLVDDLGTPYPGADATVGVTFDPQEPALALRSPLAGQVVTMTANTFEVAFDVTSWTMGDWQTCDPSDNGCGEVRVSVSGPGCTAGNPFSAHGTSSPLTVNLSSCSTITGPHTVTAWLFPSNGSALSAAWATQTADITAQ
jgi:hypothetical protein